MQADRASITASLVAAVRAFYTAMPEPYRLAEDPLAKDMVSTPLGLPARALARAPWAASALHRSLGAISLSLTHHVALRTRAIDDALRDAIEAGATELVVLGAGLDNRAMRLDELANVRVFEVDHPSTQRYKVDRLAAVRPAPRPKARELVRVAVDFERDRLEDALPAAGFDPAARSFWIWEGVTIYLTREAIAKTLRTIAGLSAPGSRVALTYSPIPHEHLPFWALPVASRVLERLGEPIQSPMSAADIAADLTAAGLTLRSDESTTDWAARYWPWQRGVRPIESLAVAER